MTRSSPPSILLVALLALGCGSSGDGGFTPDPDASMTNDATDDFGSMPTFDVQPLDRGQPPQDDGTRPPLDVSRPDVSTMMDSGVRPTDTGSGMGGVCPSSCASNADCDPCWRVGEMRVGEYCCSMGLCIYSSMTCGSSMPPPGGGDGGGVDVPETGAGFDIPETGAGFDVGGG